MIQAWLTAIEKNSKIEIYSRLCCLLGRTYHYKHDFNAAIEWYRIAIASDPDDEDP